MLTKAIIGTSKQAKEDALWISSSNFPICVAFRWTI